jgi:MarR family transcriptional regulator for hemolysin
MLDGRKPSLGDLLSAASGQWRERLDRDLARLGENGPSPAAAEVLRHLGPEGLSQGDLTARVGLTKQAVQQLVDRLEATGAVRREADPEDKRMKRVIPTATGLAQLEARRVAEKALDTQVRALFGKKTYAKLRKALKTLAEP